MNAAHLHLIVNHLPIVATWLAIPVLVFAFLRPEERSGAWNVSTLLLGIAAVASLATLVSGEPAADVLRAYGDVDAARIHTHEEAGEAGAAGSCVAACLALGLGWRTRSPRRLAATLAVALGVGGMLAWVGYTGGQIRHPEITTQS